MVIPNILSAFNYEENTNKFFEFKVSNRYEAVLYGKKKMMNQML